MQRRIRKMRSEIDQIYTNMNQAQSSNGSEFASLVETLNSALEELSVSEEELRAQNDELLEARQSLESERQRYLQLFEFAPDGYLVTDRYGNIRQANRAAVELFQVPLHFLAQKPLWSFIADTDRRDFTNRLSTMEKTGKVRDWKVLINPRNGGQRSVLINVQINHLTDQTGGEYLWLLHDITEQEQAAEALRSSQARFHTIFDRAAIGICLIDKEGWIFVSNPALQETLEYKPGALHSMRIFDLLDPKDTATFRDQYSNLVRGAIEYFQEDVQIRTQQNKTRLAQVTIASYTSDDQFQYAIVIIEDQTARKLAEAEVDELRHRLFESIEIERVEIAREIHDGPIQDLYGVAFAMSNIQAILEEGPAKAELRTTSDALQQVVAILRTICGELRPPTLTPFGLAKAIRSHAEDLDEKFPQIHIELDLQADDNKLPDRTRTALFRIYQQLIMNVLRHAQAREAKIRFSYDEEQAWLTVIDDGKGFEVPESWIDLVREGHFGLAGVAERAESVHGHVQVKSAPGKGTHVDVTIPIQ